MSNPYDPAKEPELTLTLDPFAQEVPTMEQPQAQMPAEKKEESKPIFDESQLTEQERKMVNDFAAQIDLNNSNVILQYGAGAQKKMADFSESALENVRTKDLGEIGEMLSNVVTELKNFDEEEEKRILRFLQKERQQAQFDEGQVRQGGSECQPDCGGPGKTHDDPAQGRRDAGQDV